MQHEYLRHTDVLRRTVVLLATSNEPLIIRLEKALKEFDSLIEKDLPEPLLDQWHEISSEVKKHRPMKMSESDSHLGHLYFAVNKMTPRTRRLIAEKLCELALFSARQLGS